MAVLAAHEDVSVRGYDRLVEVCRRNHLAVHDEAAGLEVHLGHSAGLVGVVGISAVRTQGEAADFGHSAVLDYAGNLASVGGLEPYQGGYATGVEAEENLVTVDEYAAALLAEGCRPYLAAVGGIEGTGLAVLVHRIDHGAVGVGGREGRLH